LGSLEAGSTVAPELWNYPRAKTMSRDSSTFYLKSPSDSSSPMFSITWVFSVYTPLVGSLFYSILTLIAGYTRYAPVVAFELCSQLSEWYSNLPSSLRFPLGSTPILDPQKAFLRAQYYSILCITKWPFIMRFVAQMPDFRGEQEMLISQGRECLESAILYIHTIETIMHSRHMLVFPNFIG
jgi:hypothetical protein